MKKILFLIGLLIFIATIISEILISRNENISTCKKIFTEEINSIIKEKNKIKYEHGLHVLKGIDIYSTKQFLFYPYNIIPANLLFDKTDIGDTLLKQANSYIIVIHKKDKIDTFVFNCNYGYW